MTKLAVELLLAVVLDDVVVDRVTTVVVILLVVEVEVVLLIAEVTALTVRVAEGDSPEDAPTMIVYTPATTLATINEPVRLPPEIVQVEAPTGLPDSEHPVSVGKNPEPDT